MASACVVIMSPCYCAKAADMHTYIHVYTYHIDAHIYLYSLYNTYALHYIYIMYIKVIKYGKHQIQHNRYIQVVFSGE